MDINNISDQELINLKKKQDDKLERYMKCYNESTERTLKQIFFIELEMNKRRLDKEIKDVDRKIEVEMNRLKINKCFNPYSKEFKEDYIRYCNFED